MLAVGLAKYLHEINTVEFDETGITGNTFIDLMPEAPDVAAAIYNAPGLAADVKTDMGRPGIQFIVRGGRDPREAYDWAWDIWTALHKLKNTTLPDGTALKLCTGRGSGPVKLGTDEKGRNEYSINFLLITGGN